MRVTLLLYINKINNDFSISEALGRINGYLANIVAALSGDWFEDNLLTTNTRKQFLNFLQEFLKT